MASFIAKQLIGNQLDSVKGALGDKKDESGSSGAREIDPEVEEALREAEQKRQEKHRRMEEEREAMRQDIRDKYGIKKKELEIDFDELMMTNEGGRVGRKRKTPAELAAEADRAVADEDSLIGMLPENMRGIASKVTEAPGKLISEATEKCILS